MRVDAVIPYRQSVLEHIGKTPLVQLTKIANGLPVQVFAKCEHLNPGGSIKDRIALAIVEDAEHRGALQVGMTLVEATAGNTGVGLALVAATRGYNLVCVMPEKMSVDKRMALTALGARVIITPNAPPLSPENFRNVARRMAEENGWFLTDQFRNPANVRVHEETTGTEILEQTDGRVGAFVAGAGTGGTLTGVGRRLKAAIPKVRIVLADPIGSALADWVETGTLGVDGSYAVEGIGGSEVPENLHRDLLDGAERVSDEESFAMVRRLVREEGLLVGGSAGTNVVAALRLAGRGDLAGPVVTVLPDSWDRYRATAWMKAWAMKEPIYLDHNATTPLLPEALEAMLPYLSGSFGNPSSDHWYGECARRAVVHAREQIADLLGSDVDEVIFTSGGTEANNLAIRGVCEALGQTKRRIVTTVIEHPATARPCEWLESRGHNVVRIGVDANGCALVEAARSAVEGDTALITVMHSNNETGVLQPIAELSAIARSTGALIHTDAAQSIGKIPVRVRDIDVDLLSVAGHKLYAPKGVGALYVKRGTPIAPVILGANHERGIRPGTENVASVVGLGVACESLNRDLKASAVRIAELRDEFWNILADAIPELGINGHNAERLPNTLNVRFPRVSGRALLSNTPEIAASTGSACHQGHDTASSAILAMGVTPEQAIGSVRLTLGRSTTASEIVTAARSLIRSWRQLTNNLT